MNSLFKRMIQIFLSFKVFIGLFTLFLPLNLPHIWREIDTLSVAYRYFQIWSLGLDSQYFLPAILNSGTTLGYMPMEFPILGVLMAPFFYFGQFWGVFLARLFLFSLHAFLLFSIYHVYKKKKILGINSEKAFLLLPLLGISSVYFFKVIPDISSTLLVLLGLGLCWEKPELSGGLIISLGLLIKPVSVITLLLLLAKKDFIKYSIRYFVFYSLTLLPCLTYYTLGISYLQSLQEGESRFFVEMRNPLSSLISFLQNPKEIFLLLLDKAAFPGALLFPFLIQKNQGRLFLILILQIFLVALLDGSHSFGHKYYFWGAMPTITLIFFPVFQKTFTHILKKPNKKNLKWALSWIFLLIFSINFLEQSVFQIRSLWSGVTPERVSSFKACKQLKQELDHLPWGKNYGFRTHPHPYPHLGLCFGERVNNKKGLFGFYLEGEKVPKECKPLSRQQGVLIVECEERKIK